MRAIKILSKHHKISVLCRVLKVNRSTFYKYINRKSSNREEENTKIRSAILEIYVKTDKRLGAGKTAILLERDYCIKISSQRAWRLMKEMNLPKMSTVKPPKIKNKALTNEGECKNILKQNFDQKVPNTVWVSDFTYIKVGSKFYYLCVILDLFSRKVVAYKVSNKIDRFLAIDALSEAVKERKPPNGLIFHTDRGLQYTSKDFRKKCDEFNITQSFSAKGHPYDNAVMECFFKYLKKEETNRRTYSDRVK